MQAQYTGVQQHNSSRNVGKLSACANSGYQALLSDFSNRPGNEVMGAQAKGVLDFICLITSRNLFTHPHLFDLICLLDIIMMYGGVREKRGEEKRGGREEGE